MKTWHGLLFATGILILAAPPARAEVVQGEIVNIDIKKQTFDLARSDPQTQAAEPEAAKIFTKPETRFEGLGGLEDLRLGDEVWADVVSDKDGVLRADIVRIDKVNIREGGINPQETAEAKEGRGNENAVHDPDA
ncbi:MAG TPA: hypothetical protein VL688_00745 [Verrucomicrobiae bacterium]|jgi:hypothetical protein|nr:hypothetical protein [Verrucomicrobiae bacterium]